MIHRIDKSTSMRNGNSGIIPPWIEFPDLPENYLLRTIHLQSRIDRLYDGLVAAIVSMEAAGLPTTGLREALHG